MTMARFEDLAALMRKHKEQDLGNGVNEGRIAEAELALGVCIRGGYRHFLTSFSYGGFAHIEIYGLGGPSYLDLVNVTLSERKEMVPPLPPSLLPFHNDGGGNQYCLDTESGAEPTVVFWSHEGGPE
jgi:hypothetical protein